MWTQHLRNLCSSSWDDLVSKLSTSTISVIIFSLSVPVLIFIAGLTYSFWQARKSGTGTKDIFKSSVIPSAIAAVLTAMVWILLFGWSVAAMIYKDHQGLVADIPRIKSEQSASDQKVMDSQRREIEQLKKQVPKLNPQCWMQSVPLRTPRVPATAQSASEAVIICNTELKAPRTMVLYYDQQPSGYSIPLVAPENTGHWGNVTMRDNALAATLTVGFVGAYQGFVVVVDGGSTTPPVVTKFVIR
jgi:hypothetical protein